jgi:arsenate reductase
VTLAERALGGFGTLDALVLIGAQFAGGVGGVLLANRMFDLDAMTLSTHGRSGTGLWLGEVVATAGLLLVVFGTARAGRTDRVAVAVGGYLVAAYWFTSSTSFANPAVTVARMFSNTFAGIAPGSVPGFVAAQVVGGVLGYALVRLLYPDAPGRAIPGA